MKFEVDMDKIENGQEYVSDLINQLKNELTGVGHERTAKKKEVIDIKLHNDFELLKGQILVLWNNDILKLLKEHDKTIMEMDDKLNKLIDLINKAIKND